MPPRSFSCWLRLAAGLNTRHGWVRSDSNRLVRSPFLIPPRLSVLTPDSQELECRPYNTSDFDLTHLRDELQKHDSGQGVIGTIVSALEP
jgi:hypothetical protein